MLLLLLRWSGLLLLFRLTLLGDRLLLGLLLSLLFRHSLLLRLGLLLRGRLLFPLALLLLSSRGLRSGLIVVIVAAADERERRRTDTCSRSGAQKHAPRNAEVGELGQRGGPIQKLVSAD